MFIFAKLNSENEIWSTTPTRWKYRWLYYTVYSSEHARMAFYDVAVDIYAIYFLVGVVSGISGWASASWIWIPYWVVWFFLIFVYIVLTLILSLKAIDHDVGSRVVKVVSPIKAKRGKVQ